jgi:hypothetical protein
MATTTLALTDLADELRIHSTEAINTIPNGENLVMAESKQIVMLTCLSMVAGA